MKKIKILLAILAVSASITSGLLFSQSTVSKYSAPNDINIVVKLEAGVCQGINMCYISSTGDITNTLCITDQTYKINTSISGYITFTSDITNQSKRIYKGTRDSHGVYQTKLTNVDIWEYFLTFKTHYITTYENV